MREYIVNDSSMHPSSSRMIREDYSIKIGMVREHVYLNGTEQTRYIVEVWSNNRLYPMTCIRTSRFGGLYNYEEYTHRGFDAGQDDAGLGNFTLVPGDMVVVAAADGDSREGIILGSLNHFGRDEILPSTGDQAYISEFNGIQTIINKSGEYRKMFKGAPTNADKLSVPPDGSEYPLPEYDLDVGFSYYEFDRTGSYLLTDNANDELPQSIKINKPDGTIEITSGNTSFIIDKNEESYTITNKITNFNSEEEWNLTTKATNIDSTDVINMKAKNINTTGELAQQGAVDIQGNMTQTGNTDITGNFSTSGTTDLAGGANPLVYDIVLIKGTGNKGAPVISTPTMLKTSLTRAT